MGKYQTSIYSSDGFTNVRYFDTIVVSFSTTEIHLNSGGWMTVSTKTRMNQTSNQYGLGFSVFQKDFKWFVSYNGKVRPFSDGMILYRNNKNYVKVSGHGGGR